MVLHLINDEEELTGNGYFYIKARTLKEVKEIHFEIMNSRVLVRTFYANFEKKVTKMDLLFQHLNYITPAERIIMISKLPPLPSFLHASNVMTLKVMEKQYNSIGAVANLLNTSLSNMMLIIYYISLPTDLYNEFPYLVEHYMFMERYLNYYISRTNGIEALEEYNEILRYILE